VLPRDRGYPAAAEHGTNWHLADDSFWRRKGSEHLDQITQHLVPPGVSIVIPVFNEQSNIALLADEIGAAMAGRRWECIWVDDGSRDGTAEELSALRQNDPRHFFLILDRNYGQSAALTVGFRNASMPLIATLDGDGQNPPGELPRLIDLLVGGNYDLVGGYRRKRIKMSRAIASRIANGFRNTVTGDYIRDVGCSLRVMRAGCVAGIPRFNGMHRFLPTLVKLNGYNRHLEVPVDHRPRTGGVSKYGYGNRLWRGIADTIAVRWFKSRSVNPVVRSFALEHSSQSDAQDPGQAAVRKEAI
jgi:dolichol-phosphate mannosyltransferase